MNVGKNIARALKRADITQAELARRIGRNRSAVCEWIGNVRKPPLDDLFAIAKALECTLESLIG